MDTCDIKGVYGVMGPTREGHICPSSPVRVNEYGFTDTCHW